MVKVLMCCSSLETKGGMVSVTKNYLAYKDWGEYKIKFIPTHFDANKYIVILFFCIQFIKIVFAVWFGNYKIAHLHTAECGSFWRKAFLMRFFHKHVIKVVMHHHAAEFEDFYNRCSDQALREEAYPYERMAVVCECPCRCQLSLTPFLKYLCRSGG